MILGSLWKYVSGGLLFLLILTGVALGMEKRHSTKLAHQNTQLAERVSQLQADLDRISSEKQEQLIVTRDRIKVVNRKIQVGNTQAERIEQAAPEPGQCHRSTAKIIMEADA